MRGMPPDEKGHPYNGEYCAACGQDCQSMVISQQNIAQQNSEIQDVLLSRSQERIIKTALDRVRAGSPLCARAASGFAARWSIVSTGAMPRRMPRCTNGCSSSWARRSKISFSKLVV